MVTLSSEAFGEIMTLIDECIDDLMKGHEDFVRPKLFEIKGIIREKSVVSVSEKEAI